MAKKIVYNPTDPAIQYTEDEIKDLESKINAVYAEAESDIQRKMDEFNAKHQKKDAKYQKMLKDGEISEEQYASWKKGQVFTGKQWAAKKNEISAILHNSNVVATSMVNKSALNVFGENSNYMAYSMEHQAGVNFGFQVYNKEAVTRLIKDDPQLLPKWKVDQKKDYVWNQKNINNALTQGIIQGESLNKISKRVSTGLAGKNENLMKTFAKTGMTQAQNSGRLERMYKLKARGVDIEKKWVATLDKRTRYSHRELDGQTVDLDDKFETEGYSIAYPGDPEAHPSLVYNCRCAIVSHFNKYPSKYDRYDNINGVPIEGMSYLEWIAAKVGETIVKKAIEKKAVEKTIAKTAENVVVENITETAVQSTTVNKTTNIATLRDYDTALQEFKAKRAASIDDMTPFLKMNDSLNQLVENNEFRMRIPTEDSVVLKSILKDGKFKTQFETGTSGGALNTDVRRKASHNLFNTPDNVKNSEYEKYGYLGSKDAAKDFNPQLEFYGDGIVTFKKNSMLDRTTITVGDSLRDAADGRYIMGSKVTDVDSTVCIGRPSMIDEFNQRVEDKIASKGIEDASSVGYATRSYFELQYHGDLTLDDVESMTIDKYILDEIKNDDKLAKIAKESGIKFSYLDEGEIVDFEF